MYSPAGSQCCSSNLISPRCYAQRPQGRGAHLVFRWQHHHCKWAISKAPVGWSMVGSCMFLRKTSKYIRDCPNLWGESPSTKDLFKKKKHVFDTVSCRSLAGSGSCAEGVGSSHMGCELHQLSAPVSAFSHLASSKCIKMHCDMIFRYGFVMVCPKMWHKDIYIYISYIDARAWRRQGWW